MLRRATDLAGWSAGTFLVALLMIFGGRGPALAQATGAAAPPPEQAKPAEGDPAAKESASTEEDPSADEAVEEVIEVIGYRAALEESVSLKRDAINARDSIVTDDIGKMPDLNLAEAIQRVPGVTIVREGGEGRQLSLRGLGADFTQVTLNGMEVPSSTGGLDSSGAINRGRAFDFNVFPAELFSRIDINKSFVSSIEEGGVGGAV
jgi:outer membrane receptor for ferrienterochelin and colicin